jgi:beta-lactamase class C
MRKYPHKILAMLVTLLLGVTFSSQALGGQNLGTALNKLEAHIQEHINKKHIPGCAVAVVYKNQIVFMKGFGVRTLSKGGPIDADTVFQLGSVSKPIAATLASILETKGLINLEDPVNKYIPNFALRSKEPPRAFKVKNILSHTSGVSRSGFNNLIESFTPYRSILHKLQNTSVFTGVGKRYDYHNVVYSLISEVTESATRQSFEQSLFWNLLQPLKMTRTTSSLQGIMSTENRAIPHTRTARGKLTALPNYSAGYYAVAPAGGINSTARDMANFLKAQMGGFPEVLNKNAIDRLQTPQISTDTTLCSFCSRPSLAKNQSYGLGWRIANFSGQKMVFHGGWLKGFTNFVAFMPEEQLGIVILHNADTKFSSRAAVKFFEHYKGYTLKASKVSNIGTFSSVERVSSKPKRNRKIIIIKKHCPTVIKKSIKKSTSPKKILPKKILVKKIIPKTKAKGKKIRKP